LEVFVLRPCVVAGPKAHALADAMPWKRLPGPVRAVARAVPLLKPVVPDPGFPLQLVHHDDVATAIALAATAPVPPGAYNIAAGGEVTITDVANALGGRGVRVPASAASAASAAISHLPFVPSLVEWLHVARTSVVMDTRKAQRELGWHPTHSSAETLAALAQAV
jgi:nucleoside-diphosphate-sugar epimerase